MQIYQAWSKRPNGGGYGLHANANLVWVQKFNSIVISRSRPTFLSSFTDIRIISNFQSVFYIKIKNYDNWKMKVCSFSVSFPRNSWKWIESVGDLLNGNGVIVKNIFLVFYMNSISILCDLCCVHSRRELKAREFTKTNKIGLKTLQASIFRKWIASVKEEVRKTNNVLWTLYPSYTGINYTEIEFNRDKKQLWD